MGVDSACKVMANRVRGGVTSPRVVLITSPVCVRPALAADLAHVHSLIVELAAYERAENEVTLSLTRSPPTSRQVASR